MNLKNMNAKNMNLKKQIARFWIIGLMLVGTSTAAAFAQVASPVPDADGNTATQPGRLDPDNHADDVLNSATPSLSPGTDNAPYNQAVDDYNAGKLPQAVQGLQSILKQDGGNTQAHKLLGMAYLRQSKFADAAMQLELVVKKAPKDVQTRDNLGSIYLKLNRPADAATQYKAALAVSSKDAIAAQGLAHTQAHAVSTDGTVSGLQKQAAQEPSPQNYAALGAALLKSGATGDAADAFSKAADLDPKNSDLRLYAGSLYARAGQNDKAIPAISQALAQHTTHAFEAHIMLAQIYNTTAPAKALAEFKQASQARPGDASVWYNMGVLEAQAGNTAGARQDYQKTLDLKPADAGLAAQAQQNLAALPAGASK